MPKDFLRILLKVLIMQVAHYLKCGYLIMIQQILAWQDRVQIEC